jgi:hypothetical protein
MIDARSLTTLQSCPRRFLLESDYEVLRWRPKSLLDACLRKGILAISNGGEAAPIAESLKAEFLQVAANPGIEVAYGANPYVIAKDCCAMLDTILRAAAGWGLPRLGDASPVRLNSSTEWSPLAFAGADGSLHRIITVDRWADDNLSREAHSWYVTGDIAATRREMILHVVEIGQVRNGRRASAWARAWQHPTMPRLKLRFVHRDGTTFKGWKAVYLADRRDLDPDEWVARMDTEGATNALVRHLRIGVPDDAVCDDTLRQMLLEASRANVLLSERSSTPWRALPMSRGACDIIGHPCPWQSACYQSVTDVASLGLYRVHCSAMVTAS